MNLPLVLPLMKNSKNRKILKGNAFKINWFPEDDSRVSRSDDFRIDVNDNDPGSTDG
jgi:hypothetical protein